VLQYKDILIKLVKNMPILGAKDTEELIKEKKPVMAAMNEMVSSTNENGK
jgi:hypothetical protein